MNTTNRILSLLSATAIVCMASAACSKVDDLFSQNTEENTLVINSLTFDPSYKTAVVKATATADYGNFFTVDSSYAGLNVYETSRLGRVINRNMGLAAVSVRDLATERFDEQGIKILVLADLTLPQADIDLEKEAVRSIRANLHNDNLFISFLKSGGVVTKTEFVTDYIMDNYFVEDDHGIDKHLYAGILRKLREVNPEGGIFNDDHAVLLAMSDGCVWGTDQPFDPEHFEVQNKLNAYCRDSIEPAHLCYVNFENSEINDFVTTSRNNEILTLCRMTDGIYLDKFRWLDFCNAVSTALGLPNDTFEIKLVNPDRRIYTGEFLNLNVEMSSPADSVILRGKTDYRVVSEFGTFIVNGDSAASVLMKGALFCLVLILVVFIVFQYIEPWIRYRIFRRKYVTRYTGPNMSVNGILVAGECYLCKAPFKKGDCIVTKCEHTMHKECWDENDYHCPEYIGHCSKGSHYYNAENLSDPRNARYYAKWLYTGIAAAFIGWVLCQMTSDSIVHFKTHQSFMKAFFSQLGQDAADMVLSPIGQLPNLAATIFGCLAFLMGFIIVRHKQWKKRLVEIFSRSIAVYVTTFFILEIGSIAYYLIDSELLEFFITVLVWAATSLMFVVWMSFRTPVKIRKKILLACLGCLIVHFLIWNSIISSYLIDYRIIQLFFFLGYVLLLTLSIATAAPRSNKYVLRTEGGIKTTDIALYKWFRANPEMIVTLGRSVDCNIQMSWDIKGDIAPLQASIFMKNSACYLKAEEDGVTLANGKPLREGKSVKLYHSTSFSIGTTKYTYTEMDVYHGF